MERSTGKTHIASVCFSGKSSQALHLADRDSGLAFSLFIVLAGKLEVYLIKLLKVIIPGEPSVSQDKYQTLWVVLTFN